MLNIIIGFLGLIAFIALILINKTNEVNKARPIVDKKYRDTRIDKFGNIGTIQSLKITPLIDSESISDNFKTENGVSMYIQAGEKTILMDLGFNRKKEHPSPLLHNMKELNLSFDSLDSIFFSHAHLDHLGGMNEQQNLEFSISHEKVETPQIPVYSPITIKPSDFNTQLSQVHVSEAPHIIYPGIASIGSIPRHLFMMGYVEEQALAFNLENKGIVLLVGCGHQTVERIIERTKKLFDEPIYAIIGGLHFPLLKNSPFSVMGLIQYIVGSDRPPWKGLSMIDLDNAIQSIKNANVQYVGLSPHDSSEYSISLFKEAFGDKYIDVKVGKTIEL